MKTNLTKNRRLYFIWTKSSRYFAEPYYNIDFLYQLRPFPRFILKFYGTTVDFGINPIHKYSGHCKTVAVKPKIKEA